MSMYMSLHVCAHMRMSLCVINSNKLRAVELTGYEVVMGNKSIFQYD